MNENAFITKQPEWVAEIEKVARELATTTGWKPDTEVFHSESFIGPVFTPQGPVYIMPATKPLWSLYCDMAQQLISQRDKE